MKSEKIANYLLNMYPTENQEEWDESGILNEVGLKQDIEQCTVCLDITSENIDQALRQNSNLIVCHHSIFQKMEEGKQMDSKQKELLERLKTNCLPCVAIHTCYDNSIVGMNYRLLQSLNIFKNITWFDNDEKNKFVIATLAEKKSVDSLISLLKSKFDLPYVFSNCEDKNIGVQTIGFCAGSGYLLFEPHLNKIKLSIDLLITGDMKYHSWLQLAEHKINLLDVGHEIENFFVDHIAKLIESQFPSVKVKKIYSKRKNKLID